VLKPDLLGSIEPMETAMPDLKASLLDDRGVIAVEGPDAREFLQGLISNDIEKVTPERAIYAALLTPQGKYLFDFFVSQAGDRLLFDCERARLPNLQKRLRMYKLRAQAELADVSEEVAVAALWGADAPAAAGLGNEAGSAKSLDDGTLFVDPRLPEAGLRAVLPTDRAAETLEGFGAAIGDAADYDCHRLALGLPDASRDLVVDKAILLESGFDELNGVDWNKGCYMGQELTARTKYRGLVKKRLVPVAIDGPAPEPGTPLKAADREVGEMRSSLDGMGLALVRLDAIETGDVLAADGATVTPRKPDWADF